MGSGGRAVAVKEPLTLIPGVFSTGDAGEAIHEQALDIALFKEMGVGRKILLLR